MRVQDVFVLLDSRQDRALEVSQKNLNSMKMVLQTIEKHRDKYLDKYVKMKEELENLKRTDYEIRDLEIKNAELKKQKACCKAIDDMLREIFSKIER